MKKIVFFNAEDQHEIDIELEMVKGLDIELELKNGRKDEDIVEECKDADGIITIYSPFTADVMKQLPKCQVIAVQAIGFNNLDLPQATEEGIALANVPDFCLYDVAMQTAALTLNCARHINELSNQVKFEKKWGYNGFVMNRLEGQTFGMIAFGNIPRHVVPMLRGFGMNFITYAPHVPDEILAEYGVSRAETIEDLLKVSDFVSVHCPLRPENVNLISDDEFRLMKPTAFIINTARGKIVDEEALCRALDQKLIAGAALDVLANEKDGDNPLYSYPNVIVTPHTAFYSEQSVRDYRVKAMEQILAVLCDKKAPKNLLNKDVLGKARFEK